MVDVVEAYTCTLCKSLHTTSKKALACEKKCRAESEEESRKSEKKQTVEYWRNYPRLNAKSFSELPKLIAKSMHELYGYDESNKVQFNMFSYHDHISNSHCAPVGEKTNWCGKDLGRPTGFPGFRCKVTRGQEPPESVRVGTQKLIEGLRSDFGNKGVLGINLCNSDVSIFLQDFPLIEAKFSEYRKTFGECEAKIREDSRSTCKSIDQDSVVISKRAEAAQVQEELEVLKTKHRDIQAEVFEYCNDTYNYALTERTSNTREVYQQLYKDLM